MSSQLDAKSAQGLLNVHEAGSSDNVSSKPSLERKGSQRQKNPFTTHNRAIVVSCCVVLLPMVAFTVVLLWMIFAHLVQPLECTSPNLCMTAAQLNQTNFTSADYIVDVPAARLVFIASWSSTLSTTFIGCVMVLCSYVVANRLLRLADEETHAHGHPTPYQVTLLIRVLNADILVVWDMIRDMFGASKHPERKKTKIPSLLKTAFGIFLLSILCSVTIQAADTYLHIVTKAFDLRQAQFADSAPHLYGFRLSDKCLQRHTNSSGKGLPENADYWSCASGAMEAGGQPLIMEPAEMESLNRKYSPTHSSLISSFDEGDMVILAPASTTPNTDYVASSFGVSSQCRPILETTCEITNSTMQYRGVDVHDISCTKDRAGLDFQTPWWPIQAMSAFSNYHRFENNTFEFEEQSALVTNASLRAAASLSLEDGLAVFRNPWEWVAESGQIDSKKSKVWAQNKTHPFLWRRPLLNVKGTNTMMLHCNTTVWDVTYRVINDEVTVLEHAKSNRPSVASYTHNLPLFMHNQLTFYSSTTGIVSMIHSPHYGMGSAWIRDANYEAEYASKHPQELVDNTALTTSKAFLVPFAGVTTPRPSLQVQQRTSQVVTRVPKSAIWMLIAANLLFGVFALVMAGLAYAASSIDAHQVHTRLSIAGMAAQLFEQSQAHAKVSKADELFEKHAADGPGKIRAVRIERTDSGGALFGTVRST